MSFTQHDIELVRRHTNYSEDDLIIDKLIALNSAIEVISDYLKTSSLQKSKHNRIHEDQISSTDIPERVSINQEIYRQIRNRMKIQQKK
jgi:hypothetical protein